MEARSEGREETGREEGLVKRKLNVYIAGRYGQREYFQEVATELTSRGMASVARWIFEDPDGDKMVAEAIRDPLAGSQFAKADLEDIRCSHVFLCFTTADSSTGGYHVELGYALATRLVPIIVGPPRNIFHALPGVVKFGAWGEPVLQFMESLHPNDIGRYH